MKTLLTAGLCCLSFAVVADDYQLMATSDFTDISAGEVPYYIDDASGRNVLAINAAVVEFREKFARAETLFTGNSGVYDVTITALGEIDGEGEFRFLVNGEVLGSAVNSLADEDWGEQYHVFDDIELAAGDMLAVESNAKSNGLIPENDEFAYARGRWRALSLVFDETATSAATNVDLSLSVNSNKEFVEEGEVAAFTFVVTNNSTLNTATDIKIGASLSDNLAFSSGQSCSQSGELLNCQLSEIAPGQSGNLTITTLALESGSAVVGGTVISAQQDSDSSNNTATRLIAVLPAGLPDIDSNGIPDTLDPPDSASPQVTDSADMNTPAVDAEPTDESDGSSSSGGGGGGAPATLLLMLVLAFRQRLLA